VLDHQSVSRQHAAIVHSADGILLIDLHSSHGTFLNDEKLEPGVPYKLDEKDVIRFGGSSRKFKLKLGPANVDDHEQSDSSSNSKRETKEKSHHSDKLGKRGRDRDRSERTSEQNAKTVKKDDGSRAPSDSIRCRHILVKHAKSRRPSSWKEPNITRTEAEARNMIEGYRKQILDKTATFEDLATQYSDCGSHSRGGDLGYFAHGAMQKPFEEAAFKLAVGEISSAVSTDSGIHVIERTG